MWDLLDGLLGFWVDEGVLVMGHGEVVLLFYW
jgi:hypothetical protein